MGASHHGLVPAGRVSDGETKRLLAGVTSPGVTSGRTDIRPISVLVARECERGIPAGIAVRGNCVTLVSNRGVSSDGPPGTIGLSRPAG